jgi:hypothetical protein
MRKVAILVALIAAMTMLLSIYIPEVAYAKTTLTIIQDRLNLARPFKSFIYVGEIIDYDVILNDKAIGGDSDTNPLTWTVSDTAVAYTTHFGQV